MDKYYKELLGIIEDNISKNTLDENTIHRFTELLKYLFLLNGNFKIKGEIFSRLVDLFVYCSNRCFDKYQSQLDKAVSKAMKEINNG